MFVYGSGVLGRSHESVLCSLDLVTRPPASVLIARPSFSRRAQYDRIDADSETAAVVRGGPDRDQAALLQRGQGAAHRSLVEADDVADPRGRDAGLDRQQRHDPPFRDVDAELPLIERAGAVRELVGDEGDERGDVAVEIERRSRLGGCGFLAGSGRRRRHIGILSCGVSGDLRVSAALSQVQNEGGLP